MMAAVDIGSVLLGRQRVNLILGNNTLHSFAKPLDESTLIDRNPLQSNEKIWDWILHEGLERTEDPS